jgi:hypothetical protein
MRKPTRRLNAQGAGEKSTDQATDQANDKITQQAEPAPADHHACKPAGDDATDNPK